MHAVERGVELRERAFADLQFGDGDVGMRGALAAPVDIDVGGELVDAQRAVLDAVAVGSELDDGRVGSARDAAAGSSSPRAPSASNARLSASRLKSRLSACFAEFAVDGQARVASAEAQLAEL